MANKQRIFLATQCVCMSLFRSWLGNSLLERQPEVVLASKSQTLQKPYKICLQMNMLISLKYNLAPFCHALDTSIYIIQPRITKQNLFLKQ